jgi:hypothetical protein
MNQKTAKRLRKTLLKNTPEVLMLLREEFGEKTEEVENPQTVWRSFKKLYKQGKVPQEMIMKKVKG